MNENPPQSPDGSHRFRWICFATAFAFGVAMLWLILDLKRDVTDSLKTAKQTVSEAKQTMSTVNENMPEIVAEVKKGTETLSHLAEDVELIKSVAGFNSERAGEGVRSLATYADEIQKVLAKHATKKDATIWIEAILGSKLKKVTTAEEFLVGLNKEMVAIILPISRSKREILYRVCHSAPPRRVPFFIQFPGSEPVPLVEFIKRHHEETAGLPEYEPN